MNNFYNYLLRPLRLSRATLRLGGIPALIPALLLAMIFSAGGAMAAGGNSGLLKVKQAKAGKAVMRTLALCDALVISPAGAIKFCTGSPETLTASGGNGTYAWYDEAGTNVSNSASYTPATGATYSVVSGSCTTYKAVYVTSAATPKISAGGPLSFCPGGNVTLTAKTTDTVTTIAGSAGNSGSAIGTGTTARFNAPYGVAVSAAGNYFVADFGNQLIRKVTPAGVVTNFGAGSFNYPTDVAFDSKGNLFVVDQGTFTIRKIDLAGTVTIFAGSGYGNINANGTSAKFGYLNGIYIDAYDNIFVCDSYSGSRIRKISPSGDVTTFTTSGVTITDAWDIVGDAAGNLYFTGVASHLIYKASTTGVVSVFAGSGSAGSAPGTGAAATFNQPRGIAIDYSGTNLYVTDLISRVLRKVVIATQAVSNLTTGTSGVSDGTFQTATYGGSVSIAFEAQGNLIVIDVEKNTVRKFTLAATPIWSTGAFSPTISVTGNQSITLQQVSTQTCTSAVSAATVVAVNTPTAAISAGGPNTFCTGGSVVLTASGGTTYLWSDAVSTNPRTISANATLTVQAISSGCTSAASTAITVTVNYPNSAPNISGATSFCSGSNTTLTTNSLIGGNEAFLWSDNSSLASLNVTAAGTYSLRIRNTVTGCTSAAGNAITVTVNYPNSAPNISG
ncbi:MAG: hypothetical protein V4543_14775, partial [Bacteroidota bacterium]